MAEGSWAQMRQSGVLSTQTGGVGLPLANTGRELMFVWPHRLPRRLESAKWARQSALGKGGAGRL